jgi:5-bromo-4-chloroindolyl phosphate hydrolysis protein
VNRKNFNNLEDEIKDIVQNAINTMDFYQLNKNIENTVGNALSEVRNALGVNHERNQSRHKSSSYKETTYKKDYNSNPKQHTRSYSVPKPNKEYVPSYKQSMTYPSNPVGKVSGILFTVFGWIFLPITGIAVLVLTLLGIILEQMSLFGTIASGIFPFLLISLFMTIRGSSIRARLRRFYRYTSLFKNRGYYSIKDLSAQTQLSNKFIIKDLRKMIALGMFPEGHIDDQTTCIILNQESYRQYLQLQKNLKAEKTKTESTDTTRPVSKPNTSTQSKEEMPINKELQTAIENGRSCIFQIREANDAIPGEEISMKLDRLETVVDKIFTHVEQHPEQLTEIQKFMEYYLPTTLKLVTAYKEFDLQPVQGENIRTAKTEIENTLNTINHAFETLLDSLFEDAAMDITTDISVLETMLAQEGLTKNKLKSKL